MLKKLQTSVLSRLKSRRNRIHILAVLAGLAYFAQSSPAQEPGKVIVPLKINHPYQQPFAVAWIEFDEDSSGALGYKSKPGSIRLGNLPGGLRASVETITESPNAYRVKVDTDGDHDLTDESPMLVNRDSSVVTNVSRKWANGKVVSLSYRLSYSRHARGQEMQETFHWQPNYVAEGQLKIGNCDGDVKVLDANGDGVFDRRDFSNATSIYIDDREIGEVIQLNDPRVVRHSDGRIEIPEELRRSVKRKWLRGEEIIEFCGGSYTVDVIEPDGSALTLARSGLRIPKVGEPLPALVMTSTDGKTIELKSLKGTITLLDFWASWCQPCVEKFAAVKQIVESHNNIKVIAINVDESSRLPEAHRVIKEYKLTWPHVATGQAEKDPVWKVFGSISNNGLTVPLYVLVDANGSIRYAGNGGDDLLELRAKVKALEQEKRIQAK